MSRSPLRSAWARTGWKRTKPVASGERPGIQWLSSTALDTLSAQTGTLMNHHSGPHSASSQFVLATVLALLFAGTGCGSKDAQNATPPSSATATSQSAAATPGGKAAIVSAEKTSFDQVTSQLDPGGSIYAYLSMSQWLEGLSERINGWRGPVLSLPNFGSDEKAHVNKAFDLVTRLVKNSGIESVSGVGIS